MKECRIEEEFVSGFCKKQNQTRTVLCELEVDAEGNRRLSEADCAYGKCEHSKTCGLMGQIV
ncbi:MAG TPA: ubiquinone biosynthesis protein UbiE [Candidatus Choladousia intestinigallinarum]|mgnify:FL=1|nr:ubiquinone biosynthesis protein UbiE [Candidatus Choladousia intestinigallinarum]